MNTENAVSALSALAQGHRLDIFRLLVQAGPGGLPAGHISDKLGISPSSLSFHLMHLKNGRMVKDRREGRKIIYGANFGTMNSLMQFLLENCCQSSQGDCA